MRALPVKKIAEMAGGKVIQGDPELIVEGLSTDTRKMDPGALFIALAGDKFDAHDFLQVAVDSKAGCLLIHGKKENVPAGFRGAVIEVPDTLKALQNLAAAYRNDLKLLVVLITGSNGKTSTKDMLRAVLGTKFQVMATAGNLNNHIGLPLSILSATEEDQIAVLEAGMNHPGEIAPLAAIATPEVGVITNIGTAHIEHMGSREAIAKEKGELAAALPDNGFLVVNGEDDFAEELKKRTKAKAVHVGGENGVVRATGVSIEATGSRFNLNFDGQSMPVLLPVPGSHMVTNALLAAAVGLYFGVTAEKVAAGLGSLDLTPGRVQQKKVGGIRFLDDSYNANPDSMEASLATLAEMKVSGNRIAMLGPMAELGKHAVDAHRNLGKLALEKGINHLCSVGEGAREITSGLMPTQGQAVHHFATQDEAAAFIQATATEGDLVLLKGSRVAAMEKVIELYATRIKK